MAGQAMPLLQTAWTDLLNINVPSTTAMSSNASLGVPSFFLIPDNTAAKQKVLNDQLNAQYLSEYRDGEYALFLSFFERDRITLGCAGSDIYIPDARGASIQRQHCYFKYNPDTGAVVLYDKSPNHSTQVFAAEDDLVVPLSQALHSVVVTRGLNRNIAIGHKKYYKFKLAWNAEPFRSFLTEYPLQPGPRGVHPYDPTKVRYLMGEQIGTGSFGTVWKAADIRDGSAMAVKRFHSLENQRYLYAIREANYMLKLSNNNRYKHDHILNILDVEYDNKEYKWIEIFMPLKEGSVKALIKSENRYVGDAELANHVLYQMVQALCYMAKHDLIHRDIKPDNILYETRQGNDNEPYYHFLLADFGLCKESAEARTMAGTETFMAPEVFHHQKQTVKVDIWSLFATVVWIYNAEKFRDYQNPRGQDVHDVLIAIAQLPLFAKIREMATRNPRERISAQDLLVRLESSDGDGDSDGNAGATGAGDNLVSSFEQLGFNDSVAGWGEESAYVPSITTEVQAQFAYRNSYSLNRNVSRMDGNSALPEFVASGSYGAVPPNQPRTYENGRIGADYLEYSNPYTNPGESSTSAFVPEAERVTSHEGAGGSPRRADRDKGGKQKGKEHDYGKHHRY